MTFSTRDQIIAKTCDLLELQGYHATGLNQIIRESGSPKGSLYYHFPGGKEELALEAVNHVGAIVLDRIRENLAAVDDVGEAVEAFVLFVAENAERSGWRQGGPITTIAMETAATNDRLREACAAIYQRWQVAFAERLTAGGVGVERAGRLAALMIASLEGGIILARTSQSKTPLAAVAVELRLLIDGAVG
jgi:TetR/AcrR family transcriptional regulator, lmrAB and yxaGH operons repressor